MFDTEIAKTLNNNFSNSVKEFDIKVTGDFPCGVSNTENLVERVIEKYKIHQSHDTKDKWKIWRKYNIFAFDLVSLVTFFKEIVFLDSNKDADKNDAPTKIFKAIINLFTV